MSDRAVFKTLPLPGDALRAAVRRLYLADEAQAVSRLLHEFEAQPLQKTHIQDRARVLAQDMRARRGAHGLHAAGMESFLQEYSLGTEEGVVLMCLAEALLRIPDTATADRLIHDKLTAAHWEKHLGHSG